jgi:DNA helicase-2/ATP-dependent DNA helicase PcrA
MLRLHYEAAGLPQNFQILDSDDQLRMVKRVVRQLDLDEARWPPKQAQWFINHNKDEGLRPSHVDPGQDPIHQQMLEIYRLYEELCQRAGVVDFAELLLRVLELIRDNDDIRGHYQRRFQHILVDEFQDTNAIQYAWIRLMAGSQTPVFVVGDDDQSIYGWRGARIENIHHFERDFSNTRVIRLEQNYRSTGTILKAANALIDNNQSRLGKELWTDSSDGEPITYYSIQPITRKTRRALSSTVSKAGLPRGAAATKLRSCIAPMRNHGNLKKPWLRAAFPTGSMAACAFSSAPRSRIRSPTCA